MLSMPVLRLVSGESVYLTTPDQRQRTSHEHRPHDSPRATPGVQPPFQEKKREKLLETVARGRSLHDAGKPMSQLSGGDGARQRLFLRSGRLPALLQRWRFACR